MEQVKQNQKQYIDLTQQHSLVQIGNQSVVPLRVSKISDKPTTHKSVGDIETMKKKMQQKNASNSRSKKKKDQAIAAGTETAETVELLTRPREYQVKFEFAQVQELSRPVIEVNNVHFRYSPKHPIIFDCVDFGIDMDR